MSPDSEVFKIRGLPVSGRHILVLQPFDQLAARMVSTGTATDAVTIAAVTSAARALIISSLMFLSLWAINVNVVHFGILLPLAFCAVETVRMVTQTGEKVTLFMRIFRIIDEVPIYRAEMSDFGASHRWPGRENR